jgi:protein-disulfide isomerase
MVAHSCALVASTLLLISLPMRNPPEQRNKAGRDVFLPPRVVLQIGLAAVAALALLIAGQTLYQPATYASTPVVAGVNTADSTPAAPRQFQLFAGRFQLNLEEVPLIGRPDAPHIMVSLFDYTCHHCRDLHTPLMQAYNTFSNRLAIINLIMPLDGSCNPLVRRTLPVHSNACALARIGLAVWLADRHASKAFDDWLFAPAIPPPPPAAEKYARQLVGSQAFDRAVTNRWINEQISTNISIYEAVYHQYKQSKMPQVIAGTNLLSGVFSHARLLQLLSEQFGLTNHAAPHL